MPDANASIIAGTIDITYSIWEGRIDTILLFFLAHPKIFVFDHLFSAGFAYSFVYKTLRFFTARERAQLEIGVLSAQRNGGVFFFFLVGRFVYVFLCLMHIMKMMWFGCENKIKSHLGIAVFWNDACIQNIRPGNNTTNKIIQIIQKEDTQSVFSTPFCNRIRTYGSFFWSVAIRLQHRANNKYILCSICLARWVTSFVDHGPGERGVLRQIFHNFSFLFLCVAWNINLPSVLISLLFFFFFFCVLKRVKSSIFITNKMRGGRGEGRTNPLWHIPT